MSAQQLPPSDYGTDSPAPSPTGAQNPMVDEATRAELAKDGVMQGPDGIFYRRTQPMMKADGTPMTLDDVKDTLSAEKNPTAGNSTGHGGAGSANEGGKQSSSPGPV